MIHILHKNHFKVWREQNQASNGIESSFFFKSESHIRRLIRFSIYKTNSYLYESKVRKLAFFGPLMLYQLWATIITSERELDAILAFDKHILIKNLYWTHSRSPCIHICALLWMWIKLPGKLGFFLLFTFLFLKKREKRCFTLQNHRILLLKPKLFVVWRVVVCIGL